jgi:CspA family cold shock protein
VLEAPVSLAKAGRKPADEMAIVVEDLIRLLDSLTSSNRFNYPEASKGRKIAALLRKVADELDA